jgi:DUF4097 and DUF4098 domain-containing protein YvlB
MDDVMRVLQMLQDGKISAQEAEDLISALRGEPKGATPPRTDAKPDESGSGTDKAPKSPKPNRIDISEFGDSLFKTVSQFQPDKIIRQVQSRIRSASRAVTHGTTTLNERVRAWSDGPDTRPLNPGALPEHREAHESEHHLDPSAIVTIENPLGDVHLAGADVDIATVRVRKHVWAGRAEDLKALAQRMDVNIHGTDSRLDVKVDAPEGYRDGTVDIEVSLPRAVAVRASARFGEIHISDLRARAEAATTSGNIRIRDVAADVRAETAGGELTLERIEGQATVASLSGEIHAREIRRGLFANATSGDVTVESVEGGHVECISVSGDVTATHVGTLAPLDINVESVSGDAVLTDAQGNIALKVVSGDVTATGISATRLQAQTVSGDVSISLREPFSGTMNAGTLSGDVTIALPSSSNVRVSLTTTSGELRCDLDAQNVVATQTIWTGQIGTGAGTLNVQTRSGDTLVREA